MTTLPALLMGLVLSAEPASVAAQAAAELPAESEILSTLRAAHPRLIALEADIQRVKRLMAGEPRAAEIYQAVRRRADEMLEAAPIEHRLIGPRLLNQSRRCVDRVYTLATVWRVEGSRPHADRAIREMLTAAAFKDWNPSHFLDTAEMTHALAIGYDWLHDVLAPDQRETIRRAIVEKGLRQAEPFYRERRWWTQSRHNWNQVCNGGIAIGALAVAEDEPELARYIVHQAVESVRLPMREFAPDGAWVEGPGYWNYATRYNVYLLAALNSALGTDFGLSDIEGFSRTGDFRVHFVGPTGRTFNFADAGDRPGEAAQMFWLARRFDRPRWAWHEREAIGGSSALHLWWYDGRGVAPGDDEPLDRHFRHADVVFLRSAWNDPRAVYVALKGGSNAVNHSHLELGTFVLDALGQRWALDLGPDDYNLPAYFGNKRWTYYRLATEGQNTLVLDSANQDARAAAPIVAFLSTPSRAHAVVDLSAAYAGQAKRAARGVALLDRRDVLIQDEIEGAKGRMIAWQMHTEADVRVEQRRAVLRLGGEQLEAQLLAPAGARFEVAALNSPPPQRQSPGVRKLVVRTPGEETAVRIAVLLSPGRRDEQPHDLLAPLEKWQGRLASPRP